MPINLVWTCTSYQTLNVTGGMNYNLCAYVTLRHGALSGCERPPEPGSAPTTAVALLWESPGTQQGWGRTLSAVTPARFLRKHANGIEKPKSE